ncbi:MAG: FG-GAP repeat protein, partial [Thermoplasmata archaeon]|nr:FG-GAP repeat protein [Thermoplasmata archaeon]
NNDGFDDILIGAKNNDEGGEDAGKTYLIFGKRTGWKKTNSLSEADISFIGEGAYNLSGASVAGAGDTNGDGYDDILIGAPGNLGTTYLIYGRNSGWQKYNNLKNANISFKGNTKGDNAGAAVAGVKDVNGDGCDDILVGAWGSEGQKGQNSGQTYLVFYNNNLKPSSIEYVKFYKDEDYSQQAISIDIGNQCYIELKGIDRNQNSTDIAVVKVWGNISDPYGIKVKLLETEENSGIYRGNIKIENITHDSHGWIASTTHEKIYVKSIENPLKFSSVLVNTQPTIIQKPNNMVEILEDQFYQQIFDYLDSDNDKMTWIFETNATWLNFGILNYTVYGTPTNDDIGTYIIKIYVEDGYGGYDEFNYTIFVKNINDPPEILKVANKSPINDTIELYAIEDEWINFTIVAKDIDINDKLHLLIDNKKFKINQYYDKQFNLSFFPTNEDVGIVVLTIQIWDNLKPPLNDTIQIIILVNNTNDSPKYPEILEPFPIMVIKSIDVINFKGYCYDPDLKVPNTTEELYFTWYSDIEGEFGNTKVFNSSLTEGIHNITFKVQDRAGSSNQTNISLKINPSNLPRPSISLISPINKKIISNTSIELQWKPEPYAFGELSYDIYIDTKSPPSKRVARNFNRTKYSINNLSDNATYYWSVIPKYRGHWGNCTNGDWSFSINTSFIQVYDIFICSELIDNIITLNPGQEQIIDIWVFNTGNGIDLIELNLYSNKLNDYIIISPISFNLNEKSQEIIPLKIKIPTDFKSGNYTIKITAKSIDAIRYKNVNISDEMNMFIIVKEIVKDEPSTYNYLYIFIILTPILVVVIIISLFLLYKTRLRKR